MSKLKSSSIYKMMPLGDGDRIVLTDIVDEHLIPLNELCPRLKTNPARGMKSKQVKKILRKHGKNKMIFPKSSFLTKVANLFHEDQNNNFSKKTFTDFERNKLFNSLLPKVVTVLRDGTQKDIPCKNVVVGDVVLLFRHDIVPADIRLIESNQVIVDNRFITGNPYEVRTHLTIHATSDCLVSPNMVFACTEILSGCCTGIVLKTGSQTVFASLKNYAKKVKVTRSRSHSNISDE